MSDSVGALVVLLVTAVVAARVLQKGRIRKADAAAETSGQAFVRTYHGSPRETAEDLQRDARRLAARGYVPTRQIYTAGSWGCGAFLVALLLAIVLIGILIFIYLVVVKPPGTLVVTYEYRGGQPEAIAEPAPAQPPDLAEALASLARMHDAGHLTPEEYAAKKEEILGRL